MNARRTNLQFANDDINAVVFVLQFRQWKTPANTNENIIALISMYLLSQMHK